MRCFNCQAEALHRAKRGLHRAVDRTERQNPRIEQQQQERHAAVKNNLMNKVTERKYIKDQEKRNSSILLKEVPNTTSISKIMLCHRD